MATQVQFRRGTTAQNASFTGALGEVTVDTDKDTLVVHDGGTAGGFEISRADASNLKFPDGAVGTPAISFSSDTNTGIYRGGTDILKFVTAGTDAVTIDASQNVDINGTVTADGLTVSTDSYRQLLLTFPDSFTSKLQLGFSNFYLQGSGTTDELTIANNSSGQTKFINQSKTSMLIDNSGDISFYEDTGTTPKLFWDASEESLGIGTSSPISALDLSGGADGTPQTITLAQGNATSKASEIVGTYTSTNEQGINFVTNNFGQSTAMSLTASGNLLVGTTDSNLTDNTTGSGVVAQANGALVAARQANTPFYVNRTGTSDGTLVDFRKDGGTVGSIGVSSSDNLYIEGSVASHAGLTFGTNQIIPLSQGGSGDNTVDLGNNGNYFKDVLVKGGIRFGTYTSANYLDDYEEGTFEVTLAPETSGTVTPTGTLDTLAYTKVGRVVNITGTINISAVSSPVGAYVRAIGLPFTVGDFTQNSERSAPSITYFDHSGSSYGTEPSICLGAGTDFRIYRPANTWAANDNFYVNFSYFTA